MHRNSAIRPILPDSLLENQSTALLWLDHGLVVRYLNPAAETLLDLDARQTLGTHIETVLVGGDEVLAVLRRALDNGETCTRRELSVAGRDAIVDLTVTPVAESGRDTELLLELVAQGRHLHISHEQELNARHAASRMVALKLAHEIKNPLGGLRGAAQLLERKLDKPQLREYTSIIMREADRLTALVDNLLGPNRPPRRAPVNLHELCDHVLQLLDVEFGGRIRWLRDYDPSLPEPQLDRDEIVQVLLNIVRNACEALDGVGQIILRTRIARQYTLNRVRHRLVACIEVIDAGPGVPLKLQTQLFTPLMSGKPHGTGLGLAVSQELANRHGGLIECTSRPGHTVFSILLPFGETREPVAS